MTQDKKSTTITIGLVILLGLLLQVVFCFADNIDTHHKAAVDFARAYFGLDGSAMSERLCDERRVVEGVNVVDKYIYLATKEAKDRGFGLFYVKDKLYKVKTNTISKDDVSAIVKLTCYKKPQLKSFFTGESYKKVDEIINLVKEDNKWKVCGKVFSLPES